MPPHCGEGQGDRFGVMTEGVTDNARRDEIQEVTAIRIVLVGDGLRGRTKATDM